MLELGVGAARLRLILESPSVKAYLAGVQAAEKLLAGGGGGSGGAREVPENAREYLGEIILGVSEGYFPEADACLVLDWARRVLEARNLLRQTTVSERALALVTRGPVNRVYGVAPGLLDDLVPGKGG